MELISVVEQSKSRDKVASKTNDPSSNLPTSRNPYYSVDSKDTRVQDKNTYRTHDKDPPKMNSIQNRLSLKAA